MNTCLTRAVAVVAALLTTATIFAAVDSLAAPGHAGSRLMAAAAQAARG
jgi:hypothetical protein